MKTGGREFEARSYHNFSKKISVVENSTEIAVGTFLQGDNVKKSFNMKIRNRFVTEDVLIPMLFTVDLSRFLFYLDVETFLRDLRS